MPAVPLPVGTAAPAIRSRVGRGSAVTWRCQSMAIAPVRHGLDALQVRAPLLSHAHGSPGSRPERADDVAGSVQRSGTSHLQEGAAHRRFKHTWLGIQRLSTCSTSSSRKYSALSAELRPSHSSCQWRPGRQSACTRLQLGL